jgi:hypothetical protein
MHLLQDLEVPPDDGRLKALAPPQSAYPTKFRQQPQAEAAASVGGIQKTLPSTYLARQCSGTSSGSGSSSEDSFERVINVTNCQLCHRPWPNKRAEMFIITYFAVRTSGDWAKIDKIVVGNFVAASQA